MHLNDEEYKQYLVSLGKKIRDLRIQMGMTQKQLSFKAGIHRTYLTDLELGNRNPSLRTLFLLAKAIEIELIELVKPE